MNRILTCKNVHQALEDGDYKDLPRVLQWMLKFHVTICFICCRQNRNIMVFQDAARAYREHEEEMAADTRLPDDARERMREALRNAS